MERKKASDFPQELLNLFDLYVHGNIGRRDFMDGAKKFATGGLTVAAIFESLRVRTTGQFAARRTSSTRLIDEVRKKRTSSARANSPSAA